MTMEAFALNHYSLFLLVLMRVVAFVAVAPILSTRVWPMWTKLGLAAFTALWMAPTLHTTVPDAVLNPGMFIVDALREAIVGIFLGIVANILIAAISVAGQAFDVQIGFSSAVLFDPALSTSMGITSSFLNWTFMMYFLGVGGLDGLLLTLMDSYQFVPIATWHLPHDAGAVLTSMMGVAMTLGVQLVAPLLVAMLLSDITFALLSRAVPQMNVFVVGLPAKLFAGLSLFAIVMPGAVYVMNRIFQSVFQELSSVLTWLGG